MMKKKDYISGGLLFVLAAVIFYYSITLVIWVDQGPGEGLFPLILSSILGALSIIILVQAWFQPGKPAEKLNIVGPNKRNFFLYLTSFIVFALFFSQVGYSLMLMAFIIFILKVAERQSWKVTLTATFSAVVFSYVLFTLCLSVSLPEGLLSGLAQWLR